MTVKTQFLVISDTHADDIKLSSDLKPDVLIHCGDLTEDSKIDEFKKTVELLQEIDAPLKLVIAGNHDFSLDEPAFKATVTEAIPLFEHDLVKRSFGDFGEARQLFEQSAGITFLDEGTHHFDLINGARLTVYASPYTPSEEGKGFQYSRSTGHQFAIGEQVDVVITHGPPHGLMDKAYSRRAGCPHLFSAVARARPRLHCFGHIHEGWGARMVAWKDDNNIGDNPFGDIPSYFTAIDHANSKMIENLSNITGTKDDTWETRLQKISLAEGYAEEGYCSTSHCEGDEMPLRKGAHTLFVNAAMQGRNFQVMQHPAWLVQLELPSSRPEVAVNEGDILDSESKEE